jgi:hypothetical protein
MLEHLTNLSATAYLAAGTILAQAVPDGAPKAPGDPAASSTRSSVPASGSASRSVCWR